MIKRRIAIKAGRRCELCASKIRANYVAGGEGGGGGGEEGGRGGGEGGGKDAGGNEGDEVSGGAALTCTQAPGDMLLIPRNWAYATRSLREYGATVAVQFASPDLNDVH